MAETDLISMDISEVKRFQRTLIKAMRAGQNVDKPLKKVIRLVVGRSKAMFGRGGRDEIRWAKLAPATIASRSRKGQGRKILKITGGIQRSIRGRVITAKGHRTSLLFSTSPVAVFHQKSKGGKLPRREIVFYTRSEVIKASQILLKDQTAAIRTAIRTKTRA